MLVDARCHHDVVSCLFPPPSRSTLVDLAAVPASVPPDFAYSSPSTLLLRYSNLRISDLPSRITPGTSKLSIPMFKASLPTSNSFTQDLSGHSRPCNALKISIQSTKMIKLVAGRDGPSSTSIFKLANFKQLLVRAVVSSLSLLSSATLPPRHLLCPQTGGSSGHRSDTWTFPRPPFRYTVVIVVLYVLLYSHSMPGATECYGVLVSVFSRCSPRSSVQATFYSFSSTAADHNNCVLASERFIQAHGVLALPPFKSKTTCQATFSWSHWVRGGLEHNGDKQAYAIVGCKARLVCPVTDPRAPRFYVAARTALTCNRFFGVYLLQLGMVQSNENKEVGDVFEALLAALLLDYPLGFVQDWLYRALNPFCYLLLDVLFPNTKRKLLAVDSRALKRLCLGLATTPLPIAGTDANINADAKAKADADVISNADTNVTADTTSASVNTCADADPDANANAKRKRKRERQEHKRYHYHRKRYPRPQQIYGPPRSPATIDHHHEPSRWTSGCLRFAGEATLSETTVY
ncbi:hypothetical protein C8F04DRAFT_1305358 [Mycena alexandri]|uniref:Uncharacterized protein n=1 Tax=Mycena alexandri TaxID=1745969 RepID=A0AAD6WSJ0_9AGAR|nr:hypothetical protein C8F04DRAFT_1305358 [Mycena alexandri]